MKYEDHGVTAYINDGRGAAATMAWFTLAVQCANYLSPITDS
jgi:hypothetical protein